jgi:hypothetical protein
VAIINEFSVTLQFGSISNTQKKNSSVQAFYQSNL